MKKDIYKTTFDIYLPATKEKEQQFLETIEVEAYENFGEEFLTDESLAQVERIKAKALGRITGSDIKTMRQRLKITQDKLSDLLHCGKKSLSRWENGWGYPSGIVNTMLRLIDEGFLPIACLEAVQGPRPSAPTENYMVNSQVAPEAKLYKVSEALVDLPGDVVAEPLAKTPEHDPPQGGPGSSASGATSMTISNRVRFLMGVEVAPESADAGFSRTAFLN